MSIVSSYTNIANAIRSKTGKTSAITPAQMVTEINTLAINPETCSTVAELESKLIASNSGKIYKYVGTSSGNYLNGNCYRVTEGAQMLPIGGRIFYVDNMVRGIEYEFYDASGNVISDQTVSGLADAAYYVKFGTSNRDKFYVADSVNCLRKYIDGKAVTWSKAKEHLEEYASEFDSVSNPDFLVGTGRRNTSWINTNKYNEDYFPYCLGSSSAISVWDFAKICNDNSVNGCNDWYVPSIPEVTKLRESGIWGSTKSEWIQTTSGRSSSELWSSSGDNGYWSAWEWRSLDDRDIAELQAKDMGHWEASAAVIRSF